jgi:DNA-binding NtrC family response regulator
VSATRPYLGAERRQAPRTADLLSADLLSTPPEAKASVRLLVVEDERALRDGLVATLRVEGYQVTAAASGLEAIEILGRARFDVVLTDLYMSPVGGIDVLYAARRAARETIVIVITGNPSVASNLDALRAGAWDYLPKPFSAAHLQLLLGRAVHTVVQRRELHELHAELLRKAGHSEHLPLLGTARAFRAAVDLARRVAPTDAPVMITGESGTGKELFAQFIHRHSRRAARPMVAVNCAALPESLLESELFGHRKGAFTGADRDKRGLVETADGGTFFLDELTEMSLALQAKLLRVLQDGVVRRVGSERTDAVVDVRFVSATNRDPQDAVKEGALRPDLLYRLRVVPLRLPPLRERREDITLLATHFLSDAWTRHHPGATAPSLTAASLDYLRRQHWPGNVRELQNVMEHTAVLAEPGQRIDPVVIPLTEDGDALAPAADALGAEILREKFHDAKDRLVAQFERVYLSRLVDRAGGNIARAARLASIDRATLYRLIEKHHIPVPREQR